MKLSLLIYEILFRQLNFLDAFLLMTNLKYVIVIDTIIMR